MSHHNHTTRTATLLLTAVMTTLWAGCSNISKLLDSDAAEATASSAHVTTALGSMLLQASLNQIDPTHFAPLDTPPDVSATGDASAGTVTLDFGVGTMVNNATLAGTAVGTYSVSGNSVTVTVSFSGLTAQTTAAGSMAVTGAMTVSATLNGTSNISGSLSGSVTTSVSGIDTTVTPNLTYAIDGTPSTGDFGVNGTIGIDSSVYGDWTATLTAINATISQTSRDINSGTLEMDRSSFPSVTVTMQFTGVNTGTLEVNPSGFTKDFTL